METTSLFIFAILFIVSGVFMMVTRTKIPSQAGEDAARVLLFIKIALGISSISVATGISLVMRDFKNGKTWFFSILLLIFNIVFLVLNTIVFYQIDEKDYTNAKTFGLWASIIPLILGVLTFFIIFVIWKSGKKNNNITDTTTKSTELISKENPTYLADVKSVRFEDLPKCGDNSGNSRCVYKEFMDENCTSRIKDLNGKVINLQNQVNTCNNKKSESQFRTMKEA